MYRYLLIFCGILNLPFNAKTQVVTSVPFMMVTPDARSAGMGDAAVAVDADANASGSNFSKMAFLKPKYGVSVSYIPWLNKVANDIDLAYLSAFHKLPNNYTAGIAIKYFKLGDVDLRDEYQQNLGVISPNEFALEASLAKSFGHEFSLGSTLKYIQSNVSTIQGASSVEVTPGRSIALDVSAFYQQELNITVPAKLSFGLNISNLGPKLRYGNSDFAYFLPANLRLGSAFTISPGAYSRLTLAVDFNKMMVPYTQAGDDLSVPASIFKSFSDAPEGFSELQEVEAGMGAEYVYADCFALRSGYHYQNAAIGDNRYFTIGTGLKYGMFNIDLSYLTGTSGPNALANTVRFTLGLYKNL